MDDIKGKADVSVIAIVIVTLIAILLCIFFALYVLCPAFKEICDLLNKLKKVISDCFSHSSNNHELDMRIGTELGQSNYCYACGLEMNLQEYLNSTPSHQIPSNLNTNRFNHRRINDKRFLNL